MPNVEKMTEEFDELLKKFEGAVMAGEWNNAAHHNNYTENVNARKQQIAGFRKRFDAAVAED